MDILKTSDLKKYYGSGDTCVKALDGVNLTVSDGEFAAIVGTSGNGKSTLLHMLGGLTGYLIIYNIFQISVMKDIHFYGLLKTIGTTDRQLKKIIHRQALILSCGGIPIGLIIGYFLGKSLIPAIMSISSIGSYETHANPFIFTGNAVFALITVAISKPSRER